MRNSCMDAAIAELSGVGIRDYVAHEEGEP
jgi:hypothetical protein